MLLRKGKDEKMARFVKGNRIFDAGAENESADSACFITSDFGHRFFSALGGLGVVERGGSP